MRPIYVLILLGALAAAVAGAADVIDPAEVVPGSVGVCLTEMEGGELEEIPLTVLGVLSASAPEQESVLVRLDGERFESTGIIAGMSGSPVYIDGRLLGALAFGWSFAKEPIGGVTPFSRMLQVGGGGAQVVTGSAKRPQLAELVSAGRAGQLGDLMVDWLAPAPATGLYRLPVVVSMGGWWSPSRGDWLEESWRRLGWVAAPGGASAAPGTTPELRPGAMVAGVMVQGDATMAAGGTVTEVRGDEVWAFGHAFLGAGAVSIPLAQARVLAVLPNQAVSFKIFEVGEVVGALEADRSHGVWGRLGAAAPTVRVEVDVDGRQYSFRTLRHPVMSPLLVAYLTQASLAARGRSLGSQTIALEVETRYGADLRAGLRESFVGDQAALDAAAMVAAIIAFLENSPFTSPALEAVVIRLETEERISSATLVDAVPERLVVAPGEVVPVRLRLRPYRGDEFTRQVEVRIPSGVPEGRLDLVVADGASWTAYDLQMRPLRPGSFDDELRLIGRLVPSGRVVLALERRETGVALPGGTVAVPPSLVVQLRSALGPNLQTTDYDVVDRTEHEMETPVNGALRIPLTVRQGHWEGS